MGKKRALPVATPASTIERARQKLGGTGTTDARSGRTVRDASGVVGIILYASGDDLDVIVGSAGVVRRTKASAWNEAEVDSEALGDLAGVVSDVASFARLAVGDRVTFRDGERTGAGVLFEKCRYGGLVARDDESIVAVGYRGLRAAVLR